MERPPLCRAELAVDAAANTHYAAELVDARVHQPGCDRVEHELLRLVGRHVALAADLVEADLLPVRQPRERDEREQLHLAARGGGLELQPREHAGLRLDQRVELGQRARGEDGEQLVRVRVLRVGRKLLHGGQRGEGVEHKLGGRAERGGQGRKRARFEHRQLSGRGALHVDEQQQQPVLRRGLAAELERAVSARRVRGQALRAVAAPRAEPVLQVGGLRERGGLPARRGERDERQQQLVAPGRRGLAHPVVEHCQDREASGGPVLRLGLDAGGHLLGKLERKRGLVGRRVGVNHLPHQRVSGDHVIGWQVGCVLAQRGDERPQRPLRLGGIAELGGELGELSAGPLGQRFLARGRPV
mmetsp:Transcript_11286/g.28532  ORF Transcript_11286/g.28532 Transcript_11286/m.28532 type:complete len:358 (+) Transcript_11286:233-1306(+)